MSTIINISESVSIAIHSMALIAKVDKKLNATQIADMLQCNRNHLAKVIQRLSKAEYISSQRGPKGGFTLNKPKESIYLINIYELMEGRLKANTCTCKERGICSFDKCVFGHLPRKASEEFIKYMSHTTISDIVGHSK